MVKYYTALGQYTITMHFGLKKTYPFTGNPDVIQEYEFI